MVEPIRRRGARAPSSRRERARALLGLGVLVVALPMGTLAAWTDSVTVTGATFSAGTMDLKVNNGDSAVDFSTLSLANMAPGYTTAGVLTVRNAGTVPLTYTVAGTVSNTDAKGLGAALVVKYTADGAVTGSGNARTCAGTALGGWSTSLSGTVLATARPLAVGASETICVQATLPTTAPSSLQGATSTATLTFSGTSS